MGVPVPGMHVPGMLPGTCSRKGWLDGHMRPAAMLACSGHAVHSAIRGPLPSPAAPPPAEAPVTGIRLVGGALSGRLEVQVKGKWAAVCNQDFGREEAAVACK